MELCEYLYFALSPGEYNMASPPVRDTRLHKPSPSSWTNKSDLPHPKLSHNEKWSFGDLRLAIAT